MALPRYSPILVSFLSLTALAGNDFVQCIQRELEWHTLHARPSTAVVSPKHIINPERTSETAAWIVRSKGEPIKKVLTELAIPEYAHQYYGPDGRFKYRPKDPIQLSVENGDEELLAAKIHFTPYEIYRAQPVSDLLVADYLHVLEKMPRAQLVIVLNPKDQGRLKKLLDKAPESVIKRVKKMWIKTDTDPSLWSQDGSKPIRRTAGAPLQTLVPLDLRSSEALNTVWMHLENSGWPTRRSIFEFEGGNVVVGERHVFVGPDVVEDNMRKFKISRADAQDALSAEFGKPVFEIKQNVIPTHEEPNMNRGIDFHIDMFFAVARNHKTGKETVLLSSPELGFKALAGKRKSSDFSSDWNTMCEQLVQGAKDDANGFLTEAEHELIATLRKTGSRSFRQQQDQVNAEAARLKALGYDVKFIPGVARADGDREPYAWEIFTYANSNFSGKNAIVPQLGIPRLDRAAAAVFKDQLGYEVIPVHSPQESLCLWGGIRCMTETYRHRVAPASK